MMPDCYLDFNEDAERELKEILGSRVVEGRR